jgi:hypothetical protein
MTALALTALTWPPATDNHRWLHYLAHMLADTHTRLAHLHHELTALRTEPDAQQLLAHLNTILRDTSDPHDNLHVHQLLTSHGLHQVTAALDRARSHRLQALLPLRRLLDRPYLPTPSRQRLHDVLDTATKHLHAAGQALVDADHHLIHALKTLPTTGGDRYSQ